jgi:hypothetical protein
VSVTPSWCEASKTFNPEIKHTPANAQLQYTSTAYNGTHTDIHITYRNAGKTALCIKMENA